MHNVSLDAFCSKYNISTADNAKLDVIEYQPGNRIVESLEDRDWQTAGFSVLGWHSFLAVHWPFRKAVKDGTWE